MASSGDGTVGKALLVLDQVAAFGRPVKFSELERDSPFPKATLYRHVQTLTNQSMLSFDPDRQVYALGIRLVRLAHAAWQQASLAPVARPFIDSLSRDLGETIHLAQLDHGQVIYVDKRNAAEHLPMFSQAGKVGPAYCTGVGKAMLAHLGRDELDQVVPQQSFHRFTENTLTTPEALLDELEAIRARGFAYDKEEHEPGIICVAVPILTGHRRVLGAMSVTTSTMRKPLEALEANVPRMQEMADRIAREAESWRFPDEAQPEPAGGDGLCRE